LKELKVFFSTAVFNQVWKFRLECQ